MERQGFAEPVPEDEGEHGGKTTGEGFTGKGRNTLSSETGEEGEYGSCFLICKVRVLLLYLQHP